MVHVDAYRLGGLDELDALEVQIQDGLKRLREILEKNGLSSDALFQ